MNPEDAALQAQAQRDHAAFVRWYAAERMAQEADERATRPTLDALNPVTHTTRSIRAAKDMTNDR